MDDIVIQTDKIVKTYASGSNEVHALRGIDLTVRRGEFIAIMGASGSGKSTLMNLLGCLDTPTSGSYSLDGVRVDGLDRNALASIRNQKLGFVFQGFNLLPRTSAVENVELPMLYDRSGRKRDTHALAVEALKRVGLGDRGGARPAQLSGGQQQRVAIARSLAMQPEVLLLDEPTSALDPEMRGEVLAVLRDLAGTCTMLVVTHEMAFARGVASRIWVFDEGRLVEDGPPAQVCDHPRSERARAFFKAAG